MKCSKRVKQFSNRELASEPVSHSIEDLVLEHGGFVRSFISKRTWNEQNVDDIYQSTLLEAMKSLHSFRNESKPRTWLCGIAYNIIRNHARKNSVIHNHEPLDALDAPDVDVTMNCMTTEDPADIYNRESFTRHVKNVSSQLPEVVRETFFLVIDSGKNYQQTAQLLDVPIGTVRSRISRAREVLKQECEL